MTKKTFAWLFSSVTQSRLPYKMGQETHTFTFDPFAVFFWYYAEWWLTIQRNGVSLRYYTVVWNRPRKTKREKVWSYGCCLFVLALSIFSLFRLNRWWHNPVAGNGQERRKKEDFIFYGRRSLILWGGGKGLRSYCVRLLCCSRVQRDSLRLLFIYDAWRTV